MTKRKIAIAIAAAALAGTCAIGGTLAWLTSSAQITNTFTMGNVKITLDEANLATENESDRTSSNQEYTVYPGAVVEKDPQILQTVLGGAGIVDPARIDADSFFKTGGSDRCAAGGGDVRISHIDPP